MFRVTKKRPPHRTATRRKEDDDDDEDDAVNEVQQEHQPPLFRVSERESQGDKLEEEEPIAVVSRRTVKKDKTKTERSRKRGLSVLKGEVQHRTKKARSGGVGRSAFSRGMTTFIDEDDEDDTNDAFPEESLDSTARQESATVPVYGKEALDALRAAQKKVAKPQELVEAVSAAAAAATATAIPVDQISSQENASVRLSDAASMEESHDEVHWRRHAKEQTFISLNGNDMGDGEDDRVLLGRDGKPLILEDPDDDHDWEEQVAKRAGISPATATTTTTVSARPSSSFRAPKATLTLEILRQNLLGTSHHLTERQEELGMALMRRQADLAQTMADRKRHQQSIETSGKACDDYQKLRYNLAMWVGALRDLEAKVRPIQKSLLDMVSLHLETVENEWKQWQDDVCATLEQCGRMDRLLGRQSLDHGGTQSEQVYQDEFGRDIGSQLKRDRDERFIRRRKRAQEVAEKAGRRGDQILELLIVREQGSDKRYDLLQEALRVAVEDLDDSYASPVKLKEHFEVWYRDYPDEYRQCYASLSLADLVHVFDRVELCRSPWIRFFLRDDDDDILEGKLFPSSVSVVPEQYDGDEGAKARNERMYRKEIVPFLKALFREYPLAVFVSEKLARVFGSSVVQIMDSTGHDSESSKDLCVLISRAAARVIEDLSVPLLKPDGQHPDESNERIMDSLEFVHTKQPIWIRSLLMSVLKIWMPIVQRISEQEYEALGKVVLGFLSETYLYFLSSLSDMPLALEHMSPIWRVLIQNHASLLESPDLIQHCAPLRAAALAYGLPAIESRQ